MAAWHSLCVPHPSFYIIQTEIFEVGPVNNPHNTDEQTGAEKSCVTCPK